MLNTGGVRKFHDFHDLFRSSLKTGPARPGHVKITLDITAVDIAISIFLYSTSTMIIYDRFSL